jgi:hypothetical protein
VHLIDAAERRRRLASRHHLAPDCRVADVATAADDQVGIHGTEPTSVYLALLARTRGATAASIEKALYTDRSLLKILGMRRTMFVVPRDLAEVINSAATQTIARRERKRLVDWITSENVVDGNVEKWLNDVEAQTIAALDEKGQATATDLTKVVPGLRVQIPFGAGKKWQGTVGVSTRMLFLLSAEARIIRARPKGTWVSSLYNWAPMKTWIGSDFKHIPIADAQADLCRRWLATYGPGRLKDLQWWAGWTVAESKRALSAVKAVEVELDGDTGWAMPADLDETPEPAPWVALLPTLDSTTMGWNDREWFMGPHTKRHFDRNGNGGPTIWSNGRVVGGWGQRKSGEVVVKLLEDIGSAAKAEVEAEAGRIEKWLDKSRVVPRFRTPIEQELSA